jgi:hypothetical protein
VTGIVWGALARAAEGADADPEHATPKVASNNAAANKAREEFRFIH